MDAGLVTKESQTQNYYLTPSLTQPFTLSSSISWALGSLGEFLIKSKLCSRCGSAALM